MNILYGDIVHALQNPIDSCINSATDRRGYVLKSAPAPVGGQGAWPPLNKIWPPSQRAGPS